MKPLGPPPRIYGMKITSNRIEAFFVLFATIVLTLIFYANDFGKTSQVIFSLGIAWIFIFFGLLKNLKDLTSQKK